MDHLRELRDEVSALRETPTVNPADILLLQEDLHALRSERSVLQPGDDVPSMVHIQELRDHVSALCEPPSVITGTSCCFRRRSLEPFCACRTRS